MNTGDIIRREDVEVTRVRADRVRREVVTASADLLGMTPRRRLRAGEPIRDNDTKAPVIVGEEHAGDDRPQHGAYDADRARARQRRRRQGRYRQSAEHAEQENDRSASSWARISCAWIVAPRLALN